MIQNDLLCLILDLLKDDKLTLCRCCLVNQEFNHIASKLLYSEVVLNIRPSVIAFASSTSPRPRSRYEKFCDALLASASLPHNAPNVKILRIKGYADSLSEALLPAVKTFENLQTVEIMPDKSEDDLFTPILAELENRPSLVNLHVNSACMDETNAPLLTRIEGLRTLGLERPNRMILLLLLGWLGRLTSLRELHLTRDCGSITPGVLRSFVPFLANITAFSLGISYSITDADLFDFLAQLPCLETVKLRHYLPSSPVPPLKRLRSLTVCHDESEDDDVVDKLCAWVLRAITGAPIEHIRFCCDEYPTDAKAPRGFDVLVEHLSHENSDTLRALDLNGWLISAESVTLLFESCAGLEELVTALDPDGFAEFKRLVPTMKHLHTAEVRVCAPFIASAEDAAQILQSSEVLRRLTVNEWKIEGSWVSEEDGVRAPFTLVARERSSPPPPLSPPAFPAARPPPSLLPLLLAAAALPHAVLSARPRPSRLHCSDVLLLSAAALTVLD
ncbi:hypothetical protein MSAN_00540500 [Mycena sanguinolenta]|uniref:F-box domain-containing protein n=1 Tax=Mycena sanguinolenta TaxID=230812 RepID=A0A8H6ZCS3_9AGAR|nr:hypothetical protein MSAN_00540500 [Mycena sanguinolenta]